MSYWSTPMNKVRVKYATAHSRNPYEGVWEIMAETRFKSWQVIGVGTTARTAWQDAARHLRSRVPEPRAVGRPREESNYDSELDAMENG